MRTRAAGKYIPRRFRKLQRVFDQTTLSMRRIQIVYEKSFDFVVQGR